VFKKTLLQSLWMCMSLSLEKDNWEALRLIGRSGLLSGRAESMRGRKYLRF
jgi:hypothetical protein